MVWTPADAMSLYDLRRVRQDRCRVPLDFGVWRTRRLEMAERVVLVPIANSEIR